MKNKNQFTLILFFIYLCLPCYAQSSESFNFDVTEIEIKENGNKFIGKNNGTAKSNDGTKIDANNFEYNKIKNILISSEESSYSILKIILQSIQIRSHILKMMN